MGSISRPRCHHLQGAIPVYPWETRSRMKSWAPGLGRGEAYRSHFSSSRPGQAGPGHVLRERQSCHVSPLSAVTSLPVTAVTNCHTLVDFKQQKWILSHFWRREAQNQCRWARTEGPAAPHSLGRRGGESSPAPSRVWWQLSFWACGPITAVCLCGHTASLLLFGSSLPLPPSPSRFRDGT